MVIARHRAGRYARSVLKAGVFVVLLSTSGSLVVCGLLVACGAKTNLKFEEREAGKDASFDAGFDVGPDVCLDEPPVRLAGQRATVGFVIDASNSMNFSLSGERIPSPSDPSRWLVMIDAINTALRGRDDRLDIGAKFFPNADINDVEPDEACRVTNRLDLAVDSNNLDGLLDRLSSRSPAGGTPTARAISVTMNALTQSRSDNPQVIVLVTDGAPNCNANLRIPCECTGLDGCDDPTFGPILCLDERETLEAIDQTFGGAGIPVYVVGVEDPTRPEYADVLDRMAIAGGRPREDGGRFFYEVSQSEELVDAFETITDQIALCVFRAPTGVDIERFNELDIEGVPVARDETRQQGWDITDAATGEITLYGLACERVSQGADRVTGLVRCTDGIR